MAPTDWTPERVAILTKMYAQKRSSTEIAAQIGGGLTRNAVIGKANRLGLTGPKNAEKLEKPWPRKSVDQLKKLHANGSTLAEIARALGNFTERAIRAQMKQMNLQPATAPARKVAAKRKVVVTAKPVPKAKPAVRPAAATPRGKGAPARAKPAPPSAGKAASTKSAASRPKAGTAVAGGSSAPRKRAGALKVAPKPVASAAKPKATSGPAKPSKVPAPATAKVKPKAAAKPAAKPKAASARNAAPKKTAPKITTRAKAAPAAVGAAEKAAPAAAAALPAPQTGDALPRMLSLVELDERSCRWPIGDPQQEDFGFCGLPAVPGKPYCAVHVGDAYQPLTSRRDRERARIR